MVRKKRASSYLQKVVAETKKVVSSGKNKVEDNEDVLSHIEDSFQSFVEDHLESAENSEEEEQIPVRKKQVYNKQSAVENSTNVMQMKEPKSSKTSKVLQEIRKLQKSTELVIPRASFGNACRDIFLQYGGSPLRISRKALECLQESAEQYLIQFFEDAYLCTLHSKRKTLMNKDLRLARRIGGRCGFYL